MLAGLVLACYIKSQRITILKVFRCSFENQFNYSLLNVRHGWGGVGLGKMLDITWGWWSN